MNYNFKMHFTFAEALNYLNIRTVGREHSALDDARNLTALAGHMIAKNKRIGGITGRF